MINKVVNNSNSDVSFSFALVGDLVLDVPDPDYWLDGIAPALKSSDIAIGHLEVPHTHRGTERTTDVPAPAAAPEALEALPRCGFNAVTLAGNHIADQGTVGITDTLDALAAIGIAACGAGSDIEQARRPALLQLGTYMIAVLSYNCVGPESCWAGDGRAGCAYLPIETEDGSPVSPTAPLTKPGEDVRHILESDIAKIRLHADLVILALHKGIVHTPAILATYEQPLARLAVDCGADAVVSHHAHIIRGIEVYRDKPIFHGLGNGCVVTRALAQDQVHSKRAAWAKRRRQLFGFEPDPAYDMAPFHPEAVNSMIGRLSWNPAGSLEFGITPVYVEPPGRPVLAEGERAEAVISYVKKITRDAGLPPVQFVQEADMWRCRT